MTATVDGLVRYPEPHVDQAHCAVTHVFLTWKTAGSLTGQQKAMIEGPHSWSYSSTGPFSPGSLHL